MNDIHSDQPSDYTSDLKSMRPNLRQAHLFCMKCRRQPDALGTTAEHIPDENGLPCGNGILYARVLCHGDKEDMAIEFHHLAMLLASGEKIPVFDGSNKYERRRILGPDGFLANGGGE